jgi:hypothetical protein
MEALVADDLEAQNRAMRPSRRSRLRLVLGIVLLAVCLLWPFYLAAGVAVAFGDGGGYAVWLFVSACLIVGLVGLVFAIAFLAARRPGAGSSAVFAVVSTTPPTPGRAGVSGLRARRFALTPGGAVRSRRGDAACILLVRAAYG